MEFLRDVTIADLFIVLNLVVIESILSIDNAAVLSVLVKRLPKPQQAKALMYGIAGAYVFRGVAILLAAWMMSLWWLKVLGGLYLCKLTWSYFSAKRTAEKTDDLPHAQAEKPKTGIATWVEKQMGAFWYTILLVELTDIAFSVDNVFAAVAMSSKLWVIVLGVFIGILAIRLFAKRMILWMDIYPTMERQAFIVIGLLGLKLVLSIVTHFWPETMLSHILEAHAVKWGLGILNLLIIFWPVITGQKKSRDAEETTADLAQEFVETFEQPAQPTTPQWPLPLSYWFQAGRMSTKKQLEYLPRIFRGRFQII